MTATFARPADDLDRIDGGARTIDASPVLRVFNGAAWNLLGSAAAQGGSLMSSIIVARLLGKDGFGQYALILSTVVASSSLAGLGLGTTATKYVSEYRSSDPDRVGRILGLSSMVALAAALCFSFGLFLAAPALAIRGNGNAETVLAFRLSCVYVFFVTLTGYQIGALTGFESFRRIARTGVASGVANVGFSLVLTTLLGFRGAVISQCVCAALLWLLYLQALRSECARRGVVLDHRRGCEERWVLYKFSVPAAASGIVVPIAMWWCSAALVRLSGYGELAIFSAAANMRAMIVFLPALITRVTMPILNQNRASGHFSAYQRTFLGAVFANTGIAACIGACLYFCGPKLLGLFGREFHAPSSFLVVMVVAAITEVLSSSLSQAVFTSGKLWRNVGMLVVCSAILVALTQALAAERGATGLALAYCGMWSVLALLYACETRKQWRGSMAL